MALSVNQSIFIPLLSGKVDRKNPEKRVVQKGSTENGCLFYALNMLRPRGPWDPQWTPEMRALEEKISDLRRRMEKAHSRQVFASIRVEFILNVLKKTSKELFLNNNIHATLCGFQQYCQQDLSKDFSVVVDKIVQNQAKLLDKNYSKAEKNYEKDNLPADALAALVDHFYLKGFNLRISEWNPKKSIEDLISILKKDGPFFTDGLYGRPYYDSEPREYQDPVINAQEDPVKKQAMKVFGWGQGQRKEDVDVQDTHAIVVCGASKSSEKGISHERVYFVDPNDASDPKKEGYRKIYVMSFKRFIEHSGLGYLRMSIPNSIEEMGLCHGIHGPAPFLEQSSLESKMK